MPFLEKSFSAKIKFIFLCAEHNKIRFIAKTVEIPAQIKSEFEPDSLNEKREFIFDIVYILFLTIYQCLF